jgi:hypothetical protein
VKICTKCGGTGTFRKGHSQCRECELAYRREHHRRNTEHEVAYRAAHRDHYRWLNVEISRRKRLERYAEVAKVKSVPCADCGQTYPPYVMDFDHRDGSTKRGNLNSLVKVVPWQVVLDEISKCDVVCARCHRLRTWHRRTLAPRPSSSPKRELLRSLKLSPCVDCGASFHYCQMDFDHARGEKLCEVSQMAGLSVDDILAEVAKCDVVCANCHRERTQVKSSGHQRTDPEKVGMTWQRRSSKNPQTVVANGTRQTTPKPKPWHAFVGTMTDRGVSKLTGISPASVSGYRKRMAIPIYSEGRTA